MIASPMFSKLPKALLVAALLAVLSACGPGTLTTKNAGEQKVSDLGTGDSGGGNSYKGRPLEAYIQDVGSHPAFQNLLEAKLAQIEAMDPAIGRLLVSVINQKVWYFLPGELSALSKESISSAVPTEQVALQDLESVWIDNNILEKMSEVDQAKMFMHEILMGVKIMRFQSRKTQCLALAVRQDLCDFEPDKNSAGPIQLKPTDYTQIRRTTAKLFEIEKMSTDATDLEDLLAGNGFSFPLKHFFAKPSAGIAGSSMAELQAIYMNSYLDGDFTTWHLYDWADLKAQHPSTDFSKGVPHGLLWKNSGYCSVGRGFRSGEPDTIRFTVIPQFSEKRGAQSRSEMKLAETRSFGTTFGGLSLLGWDRTSYSVLLPTFSIEKNAVLSLRVTFHIENRRLRGLTVQEVENDEPVPGGINDNCAKASEIQL